MTYISNITGYILHGGIVSIKIYLITIIFAVPLGMLFALGKTSRFKFIRWILDIYTWVFRGTPLLLQLFFTYFGLPAFGISLDRFTAAAITFIFNYAAYFTEIFRAGINSVDKGQYEASKALGMSYRQTMSRVVLPQALKRVLPPAGNEAITLIKDTALLAAIAIGDILRNAKEVVNRDSRIEAFIVAAIIYLIITYCIVFLFKKLEQRYSYYD